MRDKLNSNTKTKKENKMDIDTVGIWVASGILLLALIVGEFIK